METDLGNTERGPPADALRHECHAVLKTPGIIVILAAYHLRQVAVTRFALLAAADLCIAGAYENHAASAHGTRVYFSAIGSDRVGWLAAAEEGGSNSMLSVIAASASAKRSTNELSIV